MDDELQYHLTLLADEEREYLRHVVIPEPYRVVLTCSACPEQWEIFIDDRQVGYLRCRHSKWRLDAPECGGETLISEPWHPERGEYESDFGEERPAVFRRVFAALDRYLLADLAGAREGKLIPQQPVVALGEPGERRLVGDQRGTDVETQEQRGEPEPAQCVGQHQQADAGVVADQRQARPVEQ